MNNRKYNILLAQVMMLPFTKEALNETDYLYNYAKAYKMLIEFSNNEKSSPICTIKKAYSQAYNQFKEIVLYDDMKKDPAPSRELDLYNKTSILTLST